MGPKKSRKSRGGSESTPRKGSEKGQAQKCVWTQCNKCESVLEIKDKEKHIASECQIFDAQGKIFHNCIRRNSFYGNIEVCQNRAVYKDINDEGGAHHIFMAVHQMRQSGFQTGVPALFLTPKCRPRLVIPLPVKDDRCGVYLSREAVITFDLKEGDQCIVRHIPSATIDFADCAVIKAVESKEFDENKIIASFLFLNRGVGLYVGQEIMINVSQREYLFKVQSLSRKSEIDDLADKMENLSVDCAESSSSNKASEWHAVKTPSKALRIWSTTEVRVCEPELEKRRETVVGLEEIMQNVSMTVREILNGYSKVNGIIVQGSRGCGKTFLIDTITRMLNVPCIKVSGIYAESPETDLLPYIAKAKEKSPCILYVDNMHGFARHGPDMTTEEKALAVAFKKSMKSLCGSRIAIIGDTHDKQYIDPELLMSDGIFVHTLEIPLPDSERLTGIFREKLSSHLCNLSDAEILAVCSHTLGFTGHDIQTVFTIAFGKARNGVLHFEQLLQAATLVEKSIHTGNSSVKKAAVMATANTEAMGWSNVGGQKELKETLENALKYVFSHTSRQKDYTGILLYGPPGCSKTMSVRALAQETKAYFMQLSCGDLFQKYLGESEQALVTYFDEARKSAPCILFMDEMDALFSSVKGHAGSSVHNRLVLTLSRLLEDIAASQVLLIGATNRPDLIDMSLFGYGRFSQRIFVSLPDETCRRDIFRVILAPMMTCPSLNMDDLAAKTERYTGAEIQSICTMAGLSAFGEVMKAQPIGTRHFQAALKEVKSQTTDEMLEFYSRYRTGQHFS